MLQRSNHKALENIPNSAPGQSLRGALGASQEKLKILGDDPDPLLPEFHVQKGMSCSCLLCQSFLPEMCAFGSSSDLEHEVPAQHHFQDPQAAAFLC